jgi:hypothetical protein
VFRRNHFGDASFGQRQKRRQARRSELKL